MKKCLGKTKMTGNKNDNGVLEIGTDEIRKAYSEDTPGQNVESFIKEQEKAFHESKDRQKKHFSQVFGNPLQGYPHNEEFEVKEIKEEVELDENIQKIVKMFPRDNSWKKLVMKHRRSIEDFRKGKDLKGSAESDLINWAMNNGEIRSDDADEVDDFLQQILDEATTMSVYKKNMPKAKPMIQKLARARGVPVSFDKDGINVHFKGRDKDVKKLMKDIEKDKKLMKLMEFDFSHVNEKQEVFENEAGLKKKAEKSGISLGILKQVYNRGLAAYKTGHRPGATAPQWAMARVNSFITKGKGTWGKADSDLAAKVKGSK